MTREPGLAALFRPSSTGFAAVRKERYADGTMPGRRRFPPPVQQVPDLPPADDDEEKFDYTTAGRCTLLTPKVINAFCQMVEVGYPLTAVCDFIGVQDSTFQQWRRKGELVDSGATDIPNAKLYHQFVLGLRRASAVWVMRRVDQAQTSRYWMRDLKLLQLRDPVNFSADARSTEESYDPDDSFL